MSDNIQIAALAKAIELNTKSLADVQVSLKAVLDALLTQQMPALRTINQTLADMADDMSAEGSDDLPAALRELAQVINTKVGALESSAEDIAIRAATLATGGAVPSPVC